MGLLVDDRRRAWVESLGKAVPLVALGWSGRTELDDYGEVALHLGRSLTVCRTTSTSHTDTLHGLKCDPMVPCRYGAMLVGL